MWDLRFVVARLHINQKFGFASASKTLNDLLPAGHIGCLCSVWQLHCWPAAAHSLVCVHKGSQVPFSWSLPLIIIYKYDVVIFLSQGKKLALYPLLLWQRRSMKMLQPVAPPNYAKFCIFHQDFFLLCGWNTHCLWQKYCHDHWKSKRLFRTKSRRRSDHHSPWRISN